MTPMSLAGIGAGLAAIGAGIGIGKIGASAEVASKIQTMMLIAAALIEGAALFGIVVAFLK